MHTVSEVIEPSLPSDSLAGPPVIDYRSADPAEPARGLKKHGKNIWALFDQVLMSGTNFATAALTARAMHTNPAEFGTFSVIYAVLLWCNIFQSTLITQAHNVLAATRKGEDYRRYTASAAYGQLLLVMIEAAVVVPITLFAFFKGWSSTGMLIALVPSIIAWQLQEFVRRVLYTEGRYADAFLNDVISYGGQTIILAGMYAASLHGGKPFTGAGALYALAITSALGALIGVWQLRGSVERPLSFATDVKENWHFGKWLLGGEMMGWPMQLSMQVWWAALIIGTVASADLRAAQILFGPTRVITFLLGTMLPIHFARTLHDKGAAAMQKTVRQVYTILVPAVGSYCLLLAIFPKPLLNLVYGPEYAAAAATVLKLYSLCAFMGYLQMVMVCALTAARQTRQIFIGNIVGCVLALVLAPIFIKRWGAPGAIINMIVTGTIVTLMFYRAYVQQKKKGFVVTTSAEEPK